VSRNGRMRAFAFVETNSDLYHMSSKGREGGLVVDINIRGCAIGTPSGSATPAPCTTRRPFTSITTATATATSRRALETRFDFDKLLLFLFGTRFSGSFDLC
jgi:hypothetical protein